MPDEPYDLVPHREIAQLKKQIQDLKSKATSTTSSNVTAPLSQVTKSIDALHQLFSEAAKELKEDAKTEKQTAHTLNSINDKLDHVLDQHRAIAEGMVAIADMVTDFVNRQKRKARREALAAKQAQTPKPAPPPVQPATAASKVVISAGPENQFKIQTPPAQPIRHPASASMSQAQGMGQQPPSMLPPSPYQRPSQPRPMPPGANQPEPLFGHGPATPFDAKPARQATEDLFPPGPEPTTSNDPFANYTPDQGSMPTPPQPSKKRGLFDRFKK